MSHGTNSPDDAAVPELTPAERIVLDEVARLQTEGNRNVVMYDDLCMSQALSAMPQEEWLKAVEQLDGVRLIKMRHAYGVPFAFVSLTDFGMQMHARRGPPAG